MPDDCFVHITPRQAGTIGAVPHHTRDGSVAYRIDIRRVIDIGSIRMSGAEKGRTLATRIWIDDRGVHVHTAGTAVDPDDIVSAVIDALEHAGWTNPATSG